ncbi:hypothetical protein BDY19DRAFT_578966 [Irpex rosettiformis]|uniref:Uncharacterized protein n=1 Tax=Irpex rosettiformis TaxID=378272 RepID=A0ACB8UCU2_9APHY|nr:hypothetical protein BDY19DRAFT_578966 [Irpex rosettiformis]
MISLRQFSVETLAARDTRTYNVSRHNPHPDIVITNTNVNVHKYIKPRPIEVCATFQLPAPPYPRRVTVGSHTTGRRRMFLFTIVIVLARLASVACVQETHSVTLFSRCNTTSGGGAIALLNDRFVGADCETSGINCATVEFTLQNNATNGAFFNLATQPESGNHQFDNPFIFVQHLPDVVSVRRSVRSGCRLLLAN